MNTTYQPRPRQSQATRSALRMPSVTTLPAVRQEIDKCTGRIQLELVVEEDTATMATMRHVNGLVAFIATLLKNGKVIAQGRGVTALSGNNRYISRAVSYAYNSSVTDAIVTAGKVLDLLREKAELDEAYALRDNTPEAASTKQQDYLRQLVRVNVQDESEREGWEQRIPELTKAEASRAIESFRA